MYTVLTEQISGGSIYLTSHDVIGEYKMTIRDEVWHEVLLQLMRTSKFRIGDLPFDESQRHTVRRVLREMEQMSWLSRETERAATWRMGELAQRHLNVSAEQIRESQT